MTSPEFVFACITSSDGGHFLLVSLRSDWQDEQRQTDDYSEEQFAELNAAFDACGVEAYELLESTYELVESADTVREKMQSAPGFIYDPSLEQLAW